MKSATINGKEYNSSDLRFMGEWVKVNGTAEDIKSWLQWNDENGDYENLDFLTLKECIKNQL